METGEVFRRYFGRDSGNGDVVAWVAGLPGPVMAAYEAGPTGYGLARAFAGEHVECVVAAPSKLLAKPGDKVKTDRKDAAHLAGLLAAGLVTSVRVPGVEEECVRDLLRARDDSRQDLMRARHRVSKLLLRHGIVYEGNTTWSKAHLSWLGRQRFDSKALQTAFDNDLAAVVEIQSRQSGLDAALEVLAGDSPYLPVINALCCLRGVSLLTGFGLAVEIGDWSRFTGASIGSYLGLVPSERSSGQSRSQGRITKTGNKHARRLLVEAAWHHRTAYRPGSSRALQQRWEKTGPLIRARADQANRRLRKQWSKYAARGKRATTANAAVARELAGFCWSLAMMAT
jgi:transposase